MSPLATTTFNHRNRRDSARIGPFGEGLGDPSAPAGGVPHRLAAMMAMRVAEHVMRPTRFGAKVLLRVDLHGVSQFGPGDARTLIRWEWIESIDTDDGVVVRSASEAVVMPSGAFGLDSAALAEQLESARSIQNRPDVIGHLAGG
jgi:hypothetical protein